MHNCPWDKKTTERYTLQNACRGGEQNIDCEKRL